MRVFFGCRCMFFLNAEVFFECRCFVFLSGLVFLSAGVLFCLSAGVFFRPGSDGRGYLNESSGPKGQKFHSNIRRLILGLIAAT